MFGRPRALRARPDDKLIEKRLFFLMKMISQCLLMKETFVHILSFNLLRTPKSEISSINWWYSQKDYDNSHVVSFSLGGQVFTLSVPEIGVALGFYTQNEVESGWFNASIRGFHMKQYVGSLVEGQVKSAWQGIGSGDMTRIVKRRTFVIHACATFKESWLPLLLVGARERTNRPRRGGKDVWLDLGPYITRIARHVGAFARFPERFLTRGPRAGWLSLEDLI
ncbi:hypothetical protein QVD17_17048 [Tagetes erecta]|uniref:Uncharacterized protein n=1 Tax=Tagetes erecta TaxID=13708 RepID=A0AAD8KRL7_TARER|nr:hypothetical protein QVD17_17048 [Tagetes erecta]